MWQQLSVLRDPRVWKYCQYYSIVFGGFTGLSIWMTRIFHDGVWPRPSACRAARHLLLAPRRACRAFGGWLSDQFGAHSVTWWVLWVAWICLFLLSYPKRI